MKCIRCGAEILENQNYCPRCGERQPSPSGVRQSGEVHEGTLSTFIGKNSAQYLLKFRKFSIQGLNTFRPTWHWPAFLVTFWWMLYRKLYLWAIIAFVIEMIPGINLLVKIGFGVTGYYIYYKHANQKIREIEALHLPPEQEKEMLVEAGGVNRWVIIVAVILTALILLGLFAFGLLGYVALRERGSYVL